MGEFEFYLVYKHVDLHNKVYVTSVLIRQDVSSCLFIPGNVIRECRTDGSWENPTYNCVREAVQKLERLVNAFYCILEYLRLV